MCVQRDGEIYYFFFFCMKSESVKHGYIISETIESCGLGIYFVDHYSKDIQ